MLARFASPDWWDVQKPGVGTYRHAYSDNEPINKGDANGPAAECSGMSTVPVPG